MMPEAQHNAIKASSALCPVPCATFLEAGCPWNMSSSTVGGVLYFHSRLNHD